MTDDNIKIGNSEFKIPSGPWEKEPDFFEWKQQPQKQPPTMVDNQSPNHYEEASSILKEVIADIARLEETLRLNRIPRDMDQEYLVFSLGKIKLRAIHAKAAYKAAKAEAEAAADEAEEAAAYAEAEREDDKPL